ncbi:MAG: response regulator transcription factor [Pleurocapsa sp.]
MIRTLIVDDQNLIREGLRVLLEKATEIKIVGDANDGESALQKIEEIKPDVVLLDIDLPGIDGLIVSKRISLKFPEIKVIMLSSYEDESYVSKATESGAKGYLLKNVSSEELEWSIKLVYQGYSAFKSELLTTLIPRNKSESYSSSAIKVGSVKNPNDSQNITQVKPIAFTSKPSQEDEVDLAGMEALLAKNHIQQKYSKYAPSNHPQRGNKLLFHNVKINRIKKTMMSFEFKLLVFIVLFSLGFLVFVALS